MVLGSVLAMRGWIRWKRETPLASSTAISPSSTACDAARWCGMTASSGYWRSQRRPLRDCSRTSSLSRKAMARTPSHLTSKSQSSPRGTRSASIACMGSMEAGIPASCAPGIVDRSLLVFFLAGAGFALSGRFGGARAFRRRAGGPDAIGGAGGPAFGLARRQVAGDLFLGAAGEHAVGQRLDVPAGGGELVAFLDEEPFVALAFGSALHVDDGEIAIQLLTVQAELEIAAGELGGGVSVAQQVEGAAVPEHHAAPAVVAGGNIAFEIAVFHGVVFDVGGEDLDSGIERGPLGHGPGFQDAVDLQAEIVMQACGIVTLHTKVGFGRRRALTGGGWRLGRFFEAAFGSVLVERHNPRASFHLHLIRLCSILKTTAPPRGQERTFMAASVWKGHLIFGMVSFPIRLFSAARSETISFNMLHKDDDSRIRQVTYCQLEDKPISRAETVKGYEYEKDHYVVIDDEDIKKVAPRTARVMEILEFVKADQVDPIYLESSYYVAPDEGGEKAYALLFTALKDSGYYGVAKVAM